MVKNHTKPFSCILFLGLRGNVLGRQTYRKKSKIQEKAGVCRIFDPSYDKFSYTIRPGDRPVWRGPWRPGAAAGRKRPAGEPPQPLSSLFRHGAQVSGFAGSPNYLYPD